MIGELRQALFQRLEQDTVLAQMIGSHNGRPAIFGFEPASEKTEHPFVVVQGSAGSQPEPRKDAPMFEVYLTVDVFSEHLQNPIEVEGPADYLQMVLHRKPIPTDAYNVDITVQEAYPATDISSDDMLGRSVLVRFLATLEG